MGYDSKGIVLRVQSTETTRASVVFGTAITFNGTGRTITKATGSWGTGAGGDGLKVGDRVYFHGATLNTGCYTIRSLVSSVVLTVYEPVVDQTLFPNTTFIVAHEFEEIGEVVNFSGPSGALPVIDMTHLKSCYKDKKVGIADEGQVTFEVNMLYPTATAMHQRLVADRQSRTKRYFDIKLNDTSTNSSSQPTYFNFEGYVVNYTPSAGVDVPLRAAITIEITGPVAWGQKYNGDEL